MFTKIKKSKLISLRTLNKKIKANGPGYRQLAE